MKLRPVLYSAGALSLATLFLPALKSTGPATAVPARPVAAAGAVPAVSSQQLAAFAQLQQRLTGTQERGPERSLEDAVPGYTAEIGPRGLQLEREVALRPSNQASIGEAKCNFAVRLAMPLVSIGQQPLAGGTVTGSGDRVEVQREAVTEWFQNTQQGLEHGYTLHARPAGDEHEPVRLEIAPSEGWRAVPAFEKGAIALETAGGMDRILWRGLHAWDAAGNVVRAWFERSSARQEFSIAVADAGAVYPVTVDPVYVTQRLAGWPVTAGNGGSPEELIAFNGLLYFTADDGTLGRELWKSDGTPAGTVLVRDINPGPGGSFIDGMAVFGGRLYFNASHPDTSAELWKTDGTLDGTVLVKDINPGIFASSPGDFTAFGAHLYFRANGPENYELWRTDGTETGTTLVKDIYPGAGDGSYPEALTVMNGVLYFFAESSGAGNELWASDGSAIGTIMVKDIDPGFSGQFDASLTVFQSKLYFPANNGVHGRELWQSNGTTAGTVMLMDINSAGWSLPEEFTGIGNYLYFAATDAGNGRELWKLDATTGIVAMVTNINPGAAGSDPGNLLAHGGRVYFKATTAAAGRELWHSSGAEINTSGHDMNPGPASAFSQFDDKPMLSTGTELIFSGSDHLSGVELWKVYLPGATPEQVKDINPGAGASISDFFHGGPSFTLVGTQVYFAADNGVAGTELWKTDGTTGGTVMVSEVYPGSTTSAPRDLVLAGSTLYFTAQDAVNGRELWMSDGTPGNTELVKDINPGAASSFITELTADGSAVYFSADDGVSGQELWRSDGTTVGTVQVKDIRSGATGGNPSQLKMWGSTLLFRADDGSNGIELWKSNGIASGTEMVRNLNNNTPGALPLDITPAGSIAYFTADDGTEGRELWKTDGSSGGTVKVRDINLGIAASNPEFLTMMGTTLFFAADDGSNGKELWKSGGTSGTTDMVKNIAPSGGWSQPQGLFVFGSTLYFTADDASNGREVWKSDGSNGGTEMVRDINTPGTASSQPADFTTAGGILYFRATDGTSGYELWKTNGTSAGTVRVKDIFTGFAASDPREMCAFDGRLFFVATDAGSGRQIWSSDGSSDGTVRAESLSFPPPPTFPADLTPAGDKLYFVTLRNLAGTDEMQLRALTVSTAGHTLTVNASPAAGGTVTGSGTYTPATYAPITATANAGYTFVNWTGDGIANPNAATTQVIMDAGKTVTANFSGPSPPSSDLLAWWDFNNAADPAASADVVHGYNGTFLDGAHFTPAAGGRTGTGSDRAADFTLDASDRMNVASVPWLNEVGATGQITVSYWQKNTQVGTATTFEAVSPPGSFGIGAHVFYYEGQLHWDTGSTGGAVHRMSQAPPAGLDFLTWHHYAFVKRGALKEIWLDGVRISCGISAANFPQDFTKLVVGAMDPTYGALQLRGYVDDFAIYKTALGQADIVALAAGAAPDQVGSPPPPVPSGLLAWWNFDNAANAASSADLVHGYSGVFMDGAHFTAAAGGHTGAGADRAADFTLAASDRMEVAAATWLNEAGAADKLTVSFWQKMTQLTQNTSFHAVSPSSGNNRGASAHFPFFNGFCYWDTGGNTDGISRMVWPVPAGFDNFTWHHYACVKDGDYKEIWLDGQIIGCGINTANLPQDFTKLVVGADDPATGGFQLMGWVDDFAVFKTALPFSDIEALAAGTAPDQIGATSVPDIATWAASYGLTGGNTAASANPANDGLNNLLKYAFNLNPSQPDLRILTTGTGTAGLPLITFSGGSLRFEFLRRKGAAITYTPQKSNTSAAWQPLSATPAVTNIDSAWERVVIQEPLTAPLDKRAFGRVLVTQP